MLPTRRAPLHPGQMLSEEFLEPRGISQVDAAKKMGISFNRVNELVNRKRGVTADTAIRLARLLKTTPEFWMNLQTRWDLYHALQAFKKAS